jgi:hypothetical protein
MLLGVLDVIVVIRRDRHLDRCLARRDDDV